MRLCKGLTASSHFIWESANNLKLCNGNSHIWTLLLSKRSQIGASELHDCKKRFFSSRNITFVSKDTLEKPAEESRDVLTDGPPLELMQSLEEENEKLKVLWMELKDIQTKGFVIPKKMSCSHWQEAMTKKSFIQRIKFYQYLCSKESFREKKLRKNEFKKVMREQDMTYAMDKNTIFLPPCKNNMNATYNSWQCQAIQFGPNIVIDLSFDSYMSEWEKSNCAQQILNAYGFNKTNRQPFHLHLCNANPDNQVLQFIEQCHPNLYSHTCMMTVTEKSYLDIFPTEQLVYLTPHCTNELVSFDHDAVYIIGGMVDKVLKRPVSMIKAETEGVAVARLPLDQYLKWSTGSKSLTIEQVMKIMHGIKNTGCWNTALEYVPKRKLKRRNECLNDDIVNTSDYGNLDTTLKSQM